MAAQVRRRGTRKEAFVNETEQAGAGRVRRFSRSKCFVIFVILAIASVIAGAVLAMYLLNQLTPSKLAYAVMFDAGSTGSRMHIFQIRMQDGKYRLENETYIRVSPGLSSYANNPKDGALSLKPMLDKAKVIVPDSQHHNTALYLKATAGLRLLSNVQQLDILHEVGRLFNNYSFRLEEQAVEIMDGTREGFFGWLTISFLLEKDLFSNSIAALDLGGGSTQVTFLPTEQDTINHKDHMHHMRVPGGEVDIYTHSYLGGGLMYGRTETLKRSIVQSNDTSSILVQSPCIHPDVDDGESLIWEYFGYNYTVQADVEGRFSFEHCYEHARQYVTQKMSIFKPKELPNKELYLVSYYFDRAVDAGLIEGEGIEEAKLLSVGDFKLKATFECSHHTTHLKKNEFLCTDLSYIYALLHDGLGLSDLTKIWVVEKLRGTDSSWALGAALGGLEL